ncbi:MAG: AbrB/MazE/SpoVT family DNA-binding domain-containing protein [Candidatus Aenigmarchaeota archaeon]|nr:AbrB/MazE/SpoVT family DNA-binding domain-containing protein [Candidatus Aenigmarchaeota archaeon]
MKMKMKVGSKGQIIIPKVVREIVGIREEGAVIMEVKEKSVEIRSLPKEDLAKAWEERAKKHGGDLKKMGWVYGDQLYEEVFG